MNIHALNSIAAGSWNPFDGLVHEDKFVELVKTYGFVFDDTPILVYVEKRHSFRHVAYLGHCSHRLETSEGESVVINELPASLTDFPTQGEQGGEVDYQHNTTPEAAARYVVELMMSAYKPDAGMKLVRQKLLWDI